MAQQPISPGDIIALLQDRLDQAGGSQRALAKILGVNHSTISQVLRGVEPTQKILRALGLELVVTRHVVYRERKEA